MTECCAYTYAAYIGRASGSGYRLNIRGSVVFLRTEGNTIKGEKLTGRLACFLNVISHFILPHLSGTAMFSKCANGIYDPCSNVMKIYTVLGAFSISSHDLEDRTAHVPRDPGGHASGNVVAPICLQ